MRCTGSIEEEKQWILGTLTLIGAHIIGPPTAKPIMIFGFLVNNLLRALEILLDIYGESAASFNIDIAPPLGRAGIFCYSFFVRVPSGYVD